MDLICTNVTSLAACQMFRICGRISYFIISLVPSTSAQDQGEPESLLSEI
jgi:hypothetical protein